MQKSQYSALSSLDAVRITFHSPVIQAWEIETAAQEAGADRSIKLRNVACTVNVIAPDEVGSVKTNTLIAICSYPMSTLGDNTKWLMAAHDRGRHSVCIAFTLPTADFTPSLPSQAPLTSLLFVQINVADRKKLMSNEPDSASINTSPSTNLYAPELLRASPFEETPTKFHRYSDAELHTSDISPQNAGTVTTLSPVCHDMPSSVNTSPGDLGLRTLLQPSQLLSSPLLSSQSHSSPKETQHIHATQKQDSLLHVGQHAELESIAVSVLSTTDAFPKARDVLVRALAGQCVQGVQRLVTCCEDLTGSWYSIKSLSNTSAGAPLYSEARKHEDAEANNHIRPKGTLGILPESWTTVVQESGACGYSSTKAPAHRQWLAGPEPPSAVAPLSLLPTPGDSAAFHRHLLALDTARKLIGPLSDCVAHLRAFSVRMLAASHLGEAAPQPLQAAILKRIGVSITDHPELSSLPDLLEKIARSTFGDKREERQDVNVDSMRNIMFESGAPACLLEIIACVPIITSKDRECLEWAIQALTNIAFNQQAQVRIADKKFKAIWTLLARMQLERDCAEIQLKVARCLSTLCYENTESQSTLLELDGISSIMQAIKKHWSHGFAVEKLVAVICAIDGAPGFAEHFRRSAAPAIIRDLAIMDVGSFMERRNSKQRQLLSVLQAILSRCGGGHEARTPFEEASSEGLAFWSLQAAAPPLPPSRVVASSEMWPRAPLVSPQSERLLPRGLHAWLDSPGDMRR